MRLAEIVVTVVLCVASACSVEAQDGAYGRFDGSLHGDLAAGAAVTEHGHASLVWHARLRYVDTAGIALRGDHGFGENALPTRLFAGIELRPLFPARFLMDREFLVEWLDLLVDSVGMELGASFIGPTDVPPRFTMAFGLDVPIVTPSMWNHGIFVHLSAERVFGSGSYWTFSAALDLHLIFAATLGLSDPS